MRCPKCKAKYRGGFDQCTECNIPLVESLGVDENNETEGQQITIDDHEAFLVSVPDVAQADILESLLRANSIPVLRKHREAGEYVNLVIGITNLGIDILVPSKLLEAAKEILETNGLQDEAENIEPVFTKPEFVDKNEARRQTARKYLIFVLYILPGLLTIFMYVIIKYILKL